MKICIVGAGSIGGFLGVKLALAGEDVSFIARNANLEAIRSRGMRLTLADGTEQLLHPVKASASLAEAGPQDLVILGMKANQVAAVIDDLHHLLHDKTVIIPMQNGIPWWYFQRQAGDYANRIVHSVDPDGRIMKTIDPKRIVACVVYPACELAAPGWVRHIEGERFPLTRAVEITEGILNALQYSHKNGIVHRDIKPGNIMITDSGDIKVMDFGIARALADSGATLTSTWNIVGTAQYLSPEQATGGQADARSDLYSVGCLFYELVSGKPPFSGETPVAIAYQHVSAPLIPVTDIEPTLDPALNNFFSIALAKDSGDRYQSANAMLKDLKKLSKGEGITTQIPRTKRPVGRRNRIAA
ncbi:MAG: 2-dehydropantoate 2-reductase, partial [Betaproteobacteria bacterium]|nr:2-dehydropantoate 2-reductase [Betaproteobacteria bacterium]